MKPLHPQKQRGITLIEALVAMAILALGVLGLAAVQARMLVETRTTNARAAAIRLIGELSERVQINPMGANTLGGTGVSLYSDATAATFTGTLPLTRDCQTASPACTATEQATYDREIWHQRIATALPGGQASVWQISPRQLQVVIAWQANENTQATLNNSAAPAATQQVATTMQITGTAAGAQCNGTNGFICHIDFIDIPPNQ